MKMIINFILVILFVSCQTSHQPTSGKNQEALYGTWILGSMDDSLYTYYAAEDFDEDIPGIAVRKDNVFIERTSGWCATPPLSFTNIEGSWEQVEQNTLKILSEDWSNQEYIRLMEIISLSYNKLQVIYRVSETQ